MKRFYKKKLLGMAVVIMLFLPLSPNLLTGLILGQFVDVPKPFGALSEVYGVLFPNPYEMLIERIFPQVEEEYIEGLEKVRERPPEEMTRHLGLQGLEFTSGGVRPTEEEPTINFQNNPFGVNPGDVTIFPK